MADNINQATRWDHSDWKKKPFVHPHQLSVCNDDLAGIAHRGPSSFFWLLDWTSVSRRAELSECNIQVSSQPLAPPPPPPPRGRYNQQRLRPTPQVIAWKFPKKWVFQISFPTFRAADTQRKRAGGDVRPAGKHKPFLSVPSGTREVLMPLAVSWLAVSLVTTEPLSLLFGVSRAFSFLACLVPL